MKIRFVKPEAGDPERDRGIKVPYAPGKRHLARWRWYLILLVVSSPFLFFTAEFLYSSVLIQAPGFVSQEQLTIRSGSQGNVDEIYVKPLDEVKEGDPVARLANDALTSRQRELRGELSQLQNVAAQWRGGGSSPVSTESFQDALEPARQERDRLSDRMRSIQQLVQQGAATEAELNAARNQYDQASSRLGELYRTMNIQTQPAPRGNGVEIQTRILAIQSELASLDSQLQAMLVRAPKAGRVVDLAVVKGDQLTIGSKVAMLAPEGGEMHVDAYIPPKNAIYAVPGAYGTVIFPDGSHHNAMITDVPQVATEVPKAQSALLGGAELGVLVRMQLLDTGNSGGARTLTDGLPVKVNFENDWDLQRTRRFAVQLRHMWDALLDQVLARRA
jgi:multidrug resistance efflux pump